jgi:hypothetical protein
MTRRFAWSSFDTHDLCSPDATASAGCELAIVNALAVAKANICLPALEQRGYRHRPLHYEGT